MTSTNSDYPYEWKKKKSFGWRQVLISVSVVALIVTAAKLVPLLGSNEPTGPSPTPSYIIRGSRKIPSVIPGEVDFAAPELNLTDLDGNPVSLADYRGQVVLLNNWGIDCPFCEAEIPEFEAYHNAHKDQGLVIVGINADDPLEDVEAYIREMEMTFPVWLDPQKTSYRAFNNNNIPNSYLIDKTGTVRLAWDGPISIDILEIYITPLLQE